ncbi:MAG: (d)CMP kinase [Streptosporangiaceae bacterium]
MSLQVITVDGPSGSGKSSVSRGVARALGLRYLDTGATYRAVTWWMLQSAVDVHDPQAVAAAVEKPHLEVGTDPVTLSVHVDGADVSKAIRSRAVSNSVSAVSAVPEVRERLVSLQRQIIGDGGVVVEGRDIGTVVAPGAEVKVFLTASAATRAERRTRDLATDPAATIDLTHSELARRDRLDSTRSASPLTMAEDAVEIDSTSLGLPEAVDAILELARGRTESS